MELELYETYVTRDGLRLVHISSIDDYEAYGEYIFEDGTDGNSLWSPFTGRFLLNSTQENHPYDLVMTEEEWFNNG